MFLKFQKASIDNSMGNRTWRKDKTISVLADKIVYMEQEANEICSMYLTEGTSFFIWAEIGNITDMINSMIGPIMLYKNKGGAVDIQ